MNIKTRGFTPLQKNRMGLRNYQLNPGTEYSKKQKKVSFFVMGFTLIELLVVISIIGVLASIVLASLNNARRKARDVRRITDMNQLRLALDFYYDRFLAYPDGDNVGCASGGFNWDTPGNATFVAPLVTNGFLRANQSDPLTNDICGNYRYYRFPAGTGGCIASRGAFYVVEIVDMETSAGIYPGSPGFACSTRDWGTEGEWVMGKYEK